MFYPLVFAIFYTAELIKVQYLLSIGELKFVRTMQYKDMGKDRALKQAEGSHEWYLLPNSSYSKI
jgi:hypothetical protein